MPTQIHSLVEPVDREEIAPEHQLEVTGRVEQDVVDPVDDLVQVEPRSPFDDRSYAAPRVASIECLPQGFGDFDPRRTVYAVRQGSRDLGEGCGAQRCEDQVGVGREHPSVAGIGAAQADVPRQRFIGDEVAAARSSRVDVATDPEHTESGPRLRRQVVIDGLGKGREIVWGIVIDEDDLVIGVIQHLRHAVEADDGALVQIVAVAVVASIQDDRNQKTQTPSDRSSEGYLFYRCANAEAPSPHVPAPASQYAIADRPGVGSSPRGFRSESQTVACAACARPAAVDPDCGCV